MFDRTIHFPETIETFPCTAYWRADGTVVMVTYGPLKTKTQFVREDVSREDFASLRQWLRAVGVDQIISPSSAVERGLKTIVDAED